MKPRIMPRLLHIRVCLGSSLAHFARRNMHRVSLAQRVFRRLSQNSKVVIELTIANCDGFRFLA